MKIGYYVQGTADEAFVHGLAMRWCPHAQLAPGRFRGSSKTSFRREIAKALRDLRDHKACDVVVVLTDADEHRWQDVKRREWPHVPADCQHLCVFGVADRNIESWLCLDEDALARELGCSVHDLKVDDPSGLVKQLFGFGERGADRQLGKQRLSRFVETIPMKCWIENGPSFAAFYQDVRSLSASRGCEIPNELDR